MARPTLEQSLRKLRVFTKFRVALKKQRVIDYNVFMDDILQKPLFNVTWAFTWSETPQGWKYWNDVNDKLHKIEDSLADES